MSGIFGSTTIKGTRITDFAQTSASVGIPIPFLYGRAPVTGNVIWADLPPKEHRSVKKQGKGGVKQETFTYTTSYAIAFCLGPIAGYWWIKRNGKVVYSQDPNAPIEDQDYAAKWAAKVQMYNGTLSQLPSSVIEAVEGTGKVGAFRGVAYIVVPDEDVTEGGGAIPSYEAVPIAAPSEVYFTSHPYAQEFVSRVAVGAASAGGELRDVTVTAGGTSPVSSIFAPTGGGLHPLVPPHFDSVTIAGLVSTGGGLKLPVVCTAKDDVTGVFTSTSGALFNPPLGNFLDKTEAGFAATGGELSGTPSPPDPVTDYALYLRPGGASGDVTFTDSSSLARPITRTGAEVVESDSDSVLGTVVHIPAGSSGLQIAHAAADNMRAGAFQIDWKFKNHAAHSGDPLCIIGCIDNGRYGREYEWGVFVGPNYLQIYYGKRGSNQAHVRIFFRPNLDLRDVVGEQIDMSVGRDASGNWCAWVMGQPSIAYQVSPSSSGISFGAVTVGTYNNNVDFGDNDIRYLWVGGNAGGATWSPTIAYDISELSLTVGACRTVGAAYSPDYPSAAIDTDGIVYKLNFDESPFIDSGPNSLTVNTTGAVSYSTAEHASGVGSMYRGGGNSGVYVTDVKLNPRMKDFYVRLRLKPDSSSGSEQIFFDSRNISNGQGGFAMTWHPSNGVLKWCPMDGYVLHRYSSDTLDPSNWVEVEYSRVGFIGRLFLGGEMIASYTDTNDYGTGSVAFFGGATYTPLGAAGMPGHYDACEMAIGNGHTSSYTPT